MDKLCWVNLIKGKNLETRMGSRNRNSGYNQWLLFFARGKNMTVLVLKLKAFILGEVIQVGSWQEYTQYFALLKMKSEL